jgi:hypothetical protein
MSQLIQINTKLSSAEQKRVELNAEIKALKKHARELSVRTQAAADRLAGQATIELLRLGQPVNERSLLSKAKALPKHDPEALAALAERFKQDSTPAAQLDTPPS